MGEVMLACSCVLAAASVLIAFRAAPALRRDLGHVSGHLPRRALAVALALCEQLGHWAPVVRLASVPAFGGLAARLCAALGRRDVRMSALGAFAALALVTCALCAACCLVAASPLGVPVALGVVAAGCATLLGQDDRRRRVAAMTQMPEALRTLANALAAGRSLPQAISFAGRNLAEPLGGEFLRTSFEIDGGRPAEEAVRALTERVRAPGMELLGTALTVSQRTGSSLSELFDRTARMVTATCSLRRELLVKTSQARLSAKVVAALPLALVGVLTLVSPDYRAGLATGAGRTCLFVAATLDLAALWIVRALMRRSLR